MLELFVEGVHALHDQLFEQGVVVFGSEVAPLAYLRKRQAEVFQHHDAVQFLDGVLVVQAPVLGALLGRSEQALLVVILDRAHRDARTGRKLAHAQRCLLLHANHPP